MVPLLDQVVNRGKEETERRARKRVYKVVRPTLKSDIGLRHRVVVQEGDLRGL
jgi:hypothetical protein